MSASNSPNLLKPAVVAAAPAGGAPARGADADQSALQVAGAAPDRLAAVLQPRRAAGVLPARQPLRPDNVPTSAVWVMPFVSGMSWDWQDWRWHPPRSLCFRCQSSDRWLSGRDPDFPVLPGGAPQAPMQPWTQVKRLDAEGRHHDTHQGDQGWQPPPQLISYL